MITTLKDVAEAAGMSESSVSRILNGASGYKYSEQTQARVREAASRLGYQANAAARLLKQQKKNLVGLAVQLTEHPYLNRLVVAVRNELARQGYEPVIMEPSQLIPALNNAPFPSLEMLAGVLSLDLSIGQIGSEHYGILRRKLPVVALYPINSTEFDWVYTDSALGIEMLMNHLVGLGHRHLAFVGSADSSYLSDHLKLRGWKRGVKKFGLRPEETHIIDINRFVLRESHRRKETRAKKPERGQYLVMMFPSLCE